ncbi:MAG: HNH endonuclease [Planctomycetes bacterium]|nr:HNH endonuclease [Planctomycetota bacterium]
MEDILRAAVFAWLNEQVNKIGAVLPGDMLRNGFVFRNERIPLISQSGIWKPKQFKSTPISITSKKDGPYFDTHTENGYLIYKYCGPDPDYRDNRYLREAWRTGTPLVYFYSHRPSRYIPFWPVKIVADNPETLSCTVDIQAASRIFSPEILSGASIVADAGQSLIMRKYAFAEVRHRIHQVAFRDLVLTAYKESCALCKLRHAELLDAAHIIADSEAGGEPIVQNGLSLCKIHHAAFDKNIIGVTPDYEVKVREDILEEIDGPMLKYGLQAMNGKTLILPKQKKDWPDKERLEKRYCLFKLVV